MVSGGWAAGDYCWHIMGGMIEGGQVLIGDGRPREVYEDRVYGPLSRDPLMECEEIIQF